MKPPKQPKSPKPSAGPAVRCQYSRLVAPGKLKANPRNLNKHPQEQLDLYAKVIQHQGWRRAVVVSKRSGLIVTGHGAVECALAQGWTQVPVDYQDFASAADETAHMLADNRLPELAEMSETDLASILSELKGSNLDMDLTGFDADSIAALLAGLAIPGGNAVIDETALAETNTECPKCGFKWKQA